MTVGESYIVHTIGVRSAGGAGAYMAKYMAKGMLEDRAAELGMARRYSTSRNWKAAKRVRYRETEMKEWIRTWWKEGHVDLDLLQLDEGVGVKCYTVEQEAEREKLAKKRLIREIREVQLGN